MPYAPEGNPKTAKYVIVAEAPARMELIYGRPLQGPSGKLFDACLGMGGIARAQCYITNVFDTEVRKSKANAIYAGQNTLLYTPRGGFTPEGLAHRKRLQDELAETTANCYLALGATASDALGGIQEIGKWRGSVCNCPAIPGKKFIPTYHPAASLRGQYILRYLIAYDMKRLKKESEFPEIRRPPYNFLLAPTAEEAIAYLADIKLHKPITAVDIEVKNIQTSAISFAVSGLDCMSIIFSKFNLEQEHRVWLAIADVLEDPEIEKIFHNRMFDVWFLLQMNGIRVKGKIHDTMLMHHIIYPDFLKGLAFLVSIHTDQPYYKDMVKFRKKDIHKGEG